MKKTIAPAAILLALFHAPAPARADTQPAAEALFAAGRELAKKGDVAGACAKFRESHRLDPALGTRLNLASCEEELGHLAVAWQLLQSLSKALPPNDPRLGLVRERLSKLDARVPRVTIVAGAELPPGLRVLRGEVEITQAGFGVPIPTDPGENVFEVVATGFESRRYTLTLAEGDARTLSIEALRPLSARAAPPPGSAPPADPAEPKADPGVPPDSKTKTETSSTYRTLGYVGLGVGGALVVAGAVTGLFALERKNTMNAECDPDGCTDAGLSAAESGDKFATASTWLFVSGAALAATGTALLVFAPARDTRHAGLKVEILANGVRMRGAF